MNAHLIQVPRLYDIYKSNKLVNSFEEILDNLFRPLFEVTLVNDNIICTMIRLSSPFPRLLVGRTTDLDEILLCF